MSDAKKNRKWIIIGIVVVALAAIFGWKYYQEKKNALPTGIASGNGRLEAKLVDLAAKEPLRVQEVLVKEGDLVKPGDVVVKLDTVTLDAQHAEALAKVAQAQQELSIVNASIAKRESEVALAKTELARVANMLKDNASSQREYDVRKAQVGTSTAALAEEQAKLDTAKQQVKVAEANVATIQTRITDATLKSPVTGRVLYRLTEPGEVLAAGGKAITLVNLEDVYMEIFLPSAEASAVKIGSEARVTMDYTPKVAQGFVSFVSPEAQFTPKEVETKSEREKLMFRVKIQIPKELVNAYIEHVKTGVRGVGYVKLSDSATWPANLEANLLPMEKPGAPQVEKAAVTSTTSTEAK